MARSAASHSPPQCIVNSKLWNIVQFDAKLPHITTYSCQPWAPAGRGKGGQLPPPPLENRKRGKICIKLSCGIDFLLTVEFMKLKITSIINCQNKCYIVQMHFEFQNMLTVLK